MVQELGYTKHSFQRQPEAILQQRLRAQVGIILCHSKAKGDTQLTLH